MNLGTKIVDFLISKIPNFLEKKINKVKWEQFFLNTGRFLTASQENKDRFDADLAIAFSAKNLKDIAKELYHKPAFYLKDELLKRLNTLLDEYELDRREKEYFVKQFINAIFTYIEVNESEMYLQLFLGDLKNELDCQLEMMSNKLDLIYQKLGDLEEKNIFTILDIEKDLFDKSNNYGKLKLEHFKIDDDEAIRQINYKIENNENIHIIGKSKEETLYLILNEIKKHSKEYKIYIIKNSKAWDKLRFNDIKNCILIPYFNDSEVHSIRNNINIFIYNEEESYAGFEKICLRKRLKKNIIQSLEDFGYPNQKAYEIFDLTNGLYVPLKKYLFDMKQINLYKVDSNHKKYVECALLINQWKEEDGDKEFISNLVGVTYEDFIEIIDQYTIGENPIFIKNKGYINTYRLTSLYDAWNELSTTISDKKWISFLENTIIIFNEIDSSINDKLKENYKFSVSESKTKYSDYMKNGILKSLIMKKNFVPNNDKTILYKINETLKLILDKIKNISEFAEFAKYMNDVCEINPSIFLDFMNSNINNEEFINLFKLKSDFLFCTDYYIQYLWAIEKLLFIKEYQLTAIELLFKLDSKNIDYKNKNSPRETLLDVFCAWLNVIPIDVDNKIEIAKCMMSKYDNAWSIIVSNLPNSRNNISLTINKPLYLNSEEFKSEQIDRYNEIFVEYFQLCLSYCDNCKRLIKLIKKMKYYSDDIKNQVIALYNQIVNNFSDEEKIELKNELKEIIYNNRFYNNNEYSLSEESLAIYEELYNQILLKNNVYDYKYLFEKYNKFALINPVPYSNDNWYEKNNELRKCEINEKIKEFIEKNYDIIELVKLCDDCNSDLGWYIAEIFDEGTFKEETLNMLIKYSPEFNLVRYVVYFRLTNYLIFNNIVNILVNKNISSTIITEILNCGSLNKKLYDTVNSLSDEIKKLYWKRDIRVEQKSSKDEIILYIEEIIKYGDFRSGVYLIFSVNELLCSEEVYKYLIRIWANINGYNPNTMDKYYLEEILKIAQDYAINSNNYDIILKLAQFEIVVYKVIEYQNMRCYNYLIKIDPRLYANLLYYTFKSEDGKEKNEKIAENLFGLYLNTKFCPMENNGKVNYEELKIWVSKFKEELDIQKQSKLFKSSIGSLFAFSPLGTDKYMPCEAVRKVIEEEFDRELMTSYIVAERNKRGVFTPNGGKTEHQLALKYKENAEKIRINFPNTAKIFDELYEEYENDSLAERKSAEDDY